MLGIDPPNRQYRTLRATAVVGLGDHARAITLYEDLLRDAPPRSPHAAELHLSIAHSLKTLGRGPDAIDEYRAATRERADFGDAYWSLANLKTYRFIGRRARGHARCGGAACDRLDRPLSSLFRARQGLRGPWRIRRVVALLRARQCVEARREPLPSGSDRAQHGEPEVGLHPEILRAALGLRRRQHGADLCGRTAAFGFDADRADPGLALRGGGHAGARRDPALRARIAGPRARSRVAAISRPCSRSFRPRNSCASPKSIWTTPASIGPASRGSSTRCRTISGTSASFTCCSPMPRSSTRAASRWPAASGTSSSCSRAGRSSLTASRISPATTALTSS